MARRQPNIMQRGKSWVVYFREDGKQKWFTFASKDEAEVFLEQERARMRRGEQPANVKATFREAAERWYEGGKAKGWRTSTAQDYRSVLDTRLLPRFGDMPVAKITEQQIEAWLEEVRKEVSQRSVAKLLFVGGAVCERARREYGITRNPFRLIEKGKGDRPAIEVFTEEEALAIVRAAVDDQDAAIFLLAFREGLRRGEIVALQVRDVDFVHRNLHVRRNYVRNTLTTPKGKRERTVPLNIEVARALENLLRERGDPGDDELLFADPENGGFQNADQLSARFRAARDAAGARKLPLRHTRHTYCSRLAASGVHVTKIQEWAGHVSIITTQRYLVFAPSAEDADTVDAAFAPKPLQPGEPTVPTTGKRMAELQWQVAQLQETLERVLDRNGRLTDSPPRVGGR
jgi:integrase